MSTARNTWKQRERDVASYFKSKNTRTRKAVLDGLAIHREDNVVYRYLPYWFCDGVQICERRCEVIVSLPLRIKSVSNLRQHWAAKAAQTQKQRQIVRAALATVPAWMRDKGRLVYIVLTRIAPRPLDRGNLEAAFKAVQDGVADALQRDDRDPNLVWRYHQATGGTKEYGVTILLSAELKEQSCPECNRIAGVDLVHWVPKKEKEVCPSCIAWHKENGR